MDAGSVKELALESNQQVEVQRAPLLWVMIPQMLGCVWGMQREVEPVWGFICGAALLLVMFWRWHKKLGLVKLTGAAAILLLSIGWYELREVRGVPPEVLELPPRAVDLEVELEKVFKQSDKFERISAIGFVRKAPDEMEYLQGGRIYFLAYRKEIPEHLIPGSTLLLKGIVHSIDWQREEASNFRGFLEKIGIYFVSTRTIVSGVLSPAPTFTTFCYRANQECQRILRLGRGEDAISANVHIAMMLGNRSVLNAEQKEVFKYSGTMHLFAISGLHVGVIALALATFLRWLPIPIWLQTVLGLGVLWFYVQITGAQPSAMRAFIMVGVFWAGTIVLRKNSPLSALVASAVIVLIIDPEELGQLGFQLSYAVVAVILLYGLLMAKLIQDRLSPDLQFIPEESQTLPQRFFHAVKSSLGGALGVCFSAMLASTPLIVGYFKTLVLGGVVLNVLIAFIAMVTIVLGGVALVLGVFQLGWFVSWVNTISGWLIQGMLQMVEMAVSVPGYYHHFQMRHDLLAPFGVTCLILWLLVAQQQRGELGIHFFWIPPVGCAIYLGLACVPVT